MNSIHPEKDMPPQQTQIMGVVNITPDSYFESSRNTDPSAAIALGLRLASEGAHILDLGAESTNPGKKRPTPLEEEMARLIPVVQGLAAATDTPLSVDTMKWQVAAQAMEAGTSIINDVTGFRDPQMREVAASSGAKLVVMHTAHLPYTTFGPASYPDGVVNHVIRFLEQQANLLLKDGVSEDRIILDPGLGGGWFGKTVDDNLTILHNLHRIKVLGFPLLVGLSRKTFVREPLGCTVEEALAGTLALNTVAILEGADLIRVHDVKEHRDVTKIIYALQSQRPSAASSLRQQLAAHTLTPDWDLIPGALARTRTGGNPGL